MAAEGLDGAIAVLGGGGGREEGEGKRKEGGPAEELKEMKRDATPELMLDPPSTPKMKCVVSGLEKFLKEWKEGKKMSLDEWESAYGKVDGGTESDALAFMCEEAEALAMDDMDDDALSKYYDIFMINRNHARTLHSFAVFHHRKAQVGVARILYEHCLKISPRRWKTSFNLARLEQDNKMQEEACARYEEIIKAAECDDKTRCDSLAYLALLHQEHHQDYCKACDLYKQSLRITPNHIYSLDHLCALLQSCGISDDSKQLHEYVCELDGEHGLRWCPYGNSLFSGERLVKNKTEVIKSLPEDLRTQIVDLLKEISEHVPNTPTKTSRNERLSSIKSFSSIITSKNLRRNTDLKSSMLLPEEGLLTSGWMKKRGWYVTSWRDRFFVIKGRALEYYVTDKNHHNEQPRGTIWLAGCEVEDRGKVDNLFLFAVLDKVAKRTYECACESDESRQSWMSSIREVAWGDRRHALERAGSFFESFVSTAHEHPDAHGGSFALGGIVKKRGWYNTSWQDRYFLLKENVLEYYASVQAFESRSQPRGSINIFDCVVEEKGSNGKIWEFTIRDKVKKRTYECACATEKERSEWVSTIRQASRV